MSTTEKLATAYTVLRWNESSKSWKELEGPVLAASAEAAIRKTYTATGNGDWGEPANPSTTARTRDGRYVAVPARSWKPLTVTAEQTTVLKLSSPAESSTTKEAT